MNAWKTQLSQPDQNPWRPGVLICKKTKVGIQTLNLAQTCLCSSKWLCILILLAQLGMAQMSWGLIPARLNRRFTLISTNKAVPTWDLNKISILTKAFTTQITFKEIILFRSWLRSRKWLDEKIYLMEDHRNIKAMWLKLGQRLDAV